MSSRTKQQPVAGFQLPVTETDIKRGLLFTGHRLLATKGDRMEITQSP